MRVKWTDLPVERVTMKELLQFAREARLLVANPKGPTAPYPIVRIVLGERTDAQA
jgi:hypothetical protein